MPKLPGLAGLLIMHLCMFVWWPVNAQDSSVVIFGGAKEYKPFHFTDEKGNPSGFDIELYQSLAELNGWEQTYRLGDWGGIQEQLKNGGVHITPMFVSSQRRERYLFTTPILRLNHRIFGQQGETAHASIYNIKGESIAAEANGYGWHQLQHNDVDATVIGTDSEAEAIRMVARGEVAHALVNEAVGYHVINAEGLTGVVSMSPPILPVEYAFAVSPERPDLVSQINRGLQGLQEEGTIHALKQEWLNNDTPVTWQTILLYSLWFLIPLIIISMILAGLFWRRNKALIKSKLLVTSEVQRRKQAELEAEKLANHDEITGLPRSTFFRQYLEQVIQYNQGEAYHLSVGILLVQDMESIQLMAGFSVAENLLRTQATALSKHHHGFIGYLGQGRFGVVLEQCHDTQHADAIVQELIHVLDGPFDIEGTLLEPHIVSGMAHYPNHGYDARKIYRAANIALAYAKESGQIMTIYDQSMEPDPKNLTLMRELRQAIDANALQWVVQPKYCLKSHRVTGGEMLVRWHHPRHGWISPGVFVPLAEKTGLVKKLTYAAIHQAIETVRQWGAIGADWNLSVNVSGNDLADPEIVFEIIERLEDYAPLLTLEITETAVMRDVDAIIQNIRLLRQAGIKVALDDYGTGYSSLSYLKQLNFDEIKIDMSFIKSMLDSENDRKIVASSIQLGHSFNAQVTAEGVENHEIAQVLHQMGCNILQGFGIGKPMTLKEFVKFSETYKLAIEPLSTNSWQYNRNR